MNYNNYINIYIYIYFKVPFTVTGSETFISKGSKSIPILTSKLLAS